MVVIRQHVNLRQTCDTQSSIEGSHTGVGPMSMKAGDVVCILFGARAPHLLRYGSDRDTYSFIGPPFVLEFMDRTAFSIRDPVANYEEFVVE